MCLQAKEVVQVRPVARVGMAVAVVWAARASAKCAITLRTSGATPAAVRGVMVAKVAAEAVAEVAARAAVVEVA